MDSSSIFAGSKGGDVSVLVSLITQLAVANAIGARRPLFEEVARRTQRQVMFAFFHGESFGYIGSSRLVFDFQANERNKTARPKPEKHPKRLTLRDIGAFLELQQFAFGNPAFRLHGDGKLAAKLSQEVGTVLRSLSDPHGRWTASQVRPVARPQESANLWRCCSTTARPECRPPRRTLS